MDDDIKAMRLEAEWLASGDAEHRDPVWLALRLKETAPLIARLLDRLEELEERCDPSRQDPKWY